MKIQVSKEELVKKIAEGLDNNQLAKYFNCSKRTINYRKSTYGLQQNNLLTEEEKSIILEKYNSKHTIVEISKIVSRSENAVSRYLVSSGVHKVKTPVEKVKDKQCPYCDYVSDTWKSVRGHIPSCNQSTHLYYISLIKGPIDLSTLDNKNYLELRQQFYDLPSEEIASITERLRKRGFSTNVSWNLEKAKEAVVEWVNKHNKIPSSRDTYHSSVLPSDKWAKQNFKTWNKFIEYCGYEPSENSGFGKTIRYNEEITVRSNFEFYFLDNFLYNKYAFVYEKPYPGNSNRFCDFYLLEYDLYIELAGGLRPEVTKEKIDFCITNNLKLLVLYPKQVYSKNFNLKDCINKWIISST